MKSKHGIIIIFLAISFLVGVLNAPVFAERNYLFQWDEGEGTTMPGWTWSDDVAYSHPGWTLNIDGPFGGGGNFSWGYGPRCFELGGYESNNLAQIITADRAPSTPSGGALKIYEDPTTLSTATHLITWWMWSDGMPLSERGITNQNTDRFSFYTKLHGIAPLTSTEPGAQFHVGTYACAYTGLPAYGTGDGCPYEGPGNQHYYHYLSYSPDAWIHTELDQHPQHRRGSFVAGNNPTMITDGFNYMEHLSQFYMEIRYAQNQETYALFDEMYFYSTKDITECIEPNQNDISITSVWVGYWPSTRKWQIFWHDMSYVTASGRNMNDNTQSTFEVRWSTSPITNANYNQATLINPEWFKYPEATSQPNGIRRYNSWATETYTQFELPINVVNNNNKIYFAIKDVSVLGSNAGTSYPFNRTDGHDAPSSLIKTIDYCMMPGSPTYDNPTITGPNDFSTTSASVEIEGTYTVDSELTVDTVTWTLGESSGFCVAALGVFSCTVPVELGANSIVFTVTDSNSGTANDSMTITRTIPGEYTTRGAGFSIKGCTLK